MKKYVLTNNTRTIGNTTLYQIKALRSFANVNEGDLGGWIQSENNLSHEGNAWVSGNAAISGNAWVSGDDVRS